MEALGKRLDELEGYLVDSEKKVRCEVNSDALSVT